MQLGGKLTYPRWKGDCKQYIHDISWHWDNNANWTYSMYVQKHQKATTKATLTKALYVTPDQWQHADVHIDLEATQGT